jgi:hypothetical protein
MIPRQIERLTLIPPPEIRTCIPKSNPSIKKCACTGARKETIHGSYFSDPEAARPLVKAILQAIDLSHPNVVADLGGGTGFILKELLKKAGIAGRPACERR